MMFQFLEVDEIGEQYAPKHLGFDLRAMALVAIPLSDEVDACVAKGGSHWAVLVCRNGKFELYDSLGHSSGGATQAIAQKAQVVAAKLKAAFGLGGGRPHEAPKIARPDCPAQTNGYDCGMYVVAITRSLCRGLLATVDGSLHAEAPLQAAVTPATVTALRQEAATVAKGLARAQAVRNLLSGGARRR